MPAKEYNGHRSWAAWNVSLWIGNDEPLYRAAVEACKASTTWPGAVRRFFKDTGLKGTKTPDGAGYSELSVKLALQGLEVALKGKGA